MPTKRSTVPSDRVPQPAQDRPTTAIGLSDESNPNRRKRRASLDLGLEHAEKRQQTQRISRAETNRTSPNSGRKRGYSNEVQGDGHGSSKRQCLRPAGKTQWWTRWFWSKERSVQGNGEEDVGSK